MMASNLSRNRTRGARAASALLCVTLFSLLTGCAAWLPVAETAAPSGAPVFIERFNLSGRLSVRVADRLDTTKIEWLRDGTRETLRFYSPLGSQLAEVSATAHGATLTRGESIEHAPSIGALTQVLVGVAINTELLARWVQGIDVDATDARGASDISANWTIRAENLRAVDGVKGGRIASRISVSRDDTALRLFVDHFRPL